MAGHEEHKLKLLCTSWNEHFVAIALSFVLNPVKGGVEENFIFAHITFSCCLLSKCLESYAFSFFLPL